MGGGKESTEEFGLSEVFYLFFLSSWFDEYENERRFISGRETLALAASAG